MSFKKKNSFLKITTYLGNLLNEKLYNINKGVYETSLSILIKNCRNKLIKYFCFIREKSIY